MQKKVKGLQTVLSNLNNLKQQIPDSALGVLRAGGKAIQTSAQQFAPLDQGPLEHSIKLTEQTTPERVSVTIYVDESTPTIRPGVTVGDYAMQMHEGSYSLGPRSRAKAASLGVQVGPKYLERALKVNRPAVLAALRNAVKQVIR